MSSYAGRHAELYDLFYADKPYNDEAEFVDRQLRAHGVEPPCRLLELACGTGRHALALEQLGYETVAVDYSPDMIRRAQLRGVAANSQVDFRQADMRKLSLTEPPFDAAVCLFDSIGYVQTNAALGATLRGIRNHVKPGGLFVFEFWHAGAMLSGFDPLRVRRWRTAEGEVLRISETQLDCSQQLSHVTYTVYELFADGRYATFQETQTNRYFLVQEMAALLAHAGWSSLRWFAGFQPSEQITQQTWHVVAIAQRTAQLDRAIRGEELTHVVL